MWQVRLDQESPLAALPGAPAWYVAALARVNTRYHDHAAWTEADAEEIIAMIEAGRSLSVRPDDYARPATKDGYTWYLADTASAAAATRLLYGAPVAPGAIKRLGDAFLAGLKHPLPSQRTMSIVCLVQSGIAEDPALRHHVEQLQQDPDREVASMARLQYGYLMDSLDSKRVRGKLPAGW